IKNLSTKTEDKEHRLHLVEGIFLLSLMHIIRISLLLLQLMHNCLFIVNYSMLGSMFG
ncbi:hypothetical protein ACJX0J_030408, partial [Zea mays]